MLIDVAHPSAPLPPEVANADPATRSRYRQARRLSHLLDSQFEIPSLNRSFGVDAILGFIPGIGGVAGLALAGIVIAQGVGIGARGATVARMVLNTFVDAMISSVPLLGGIFAALFKANERNVRLLSTHALDPDRTRQESRKVVGIAAVGIIATVIVVLFAAIALLIWAVSRIF